MVKDLIVSSAFAVIGIVLYLATLNIQGAARTHGHERVLELSYTLARLGFVIMVALITEAVWQVGDVPWTWRSTLYIIASVAVSVGYLGIAIEGRKVARRDK
jgi:hypothetical protein